MRIYQDYQDFVIIFPKGVRIQGFQTAISARPEWNVKKSRPEILNESNSNLEPFFSFSDYISCNSMRCGLQKNSRVASGAPIINGS